MLELLWNLPVLREFHSSRVGRRMGAVSCDVKWRAKQVEQGELLSFGLMI